MTTVDDPAHRTASQTGERREAYRGEMADLLDLDPTALSDTVCLVDDLSLDSLAMMSLLTWLESHGVTVGSDRDWPASVGQVLSLLEKTAFPGLSITVANGPGGGLRGPAEVTMASRPPGTGSSLVPVLGNRSFRLSPVTPEDVGFLYTLAVRPETGFRWRYRGAPPPVDRFAAELWAQVLVQYVVRRTGDGAPIGHVVAHAADQSLHHANVAAVFDPQNTGTGLGAQAVALFVRYLFHTFPLHKLYLRIPGYNWPQVRSGANRLFQVEGVLRDHDYYAGRYWDEYLCAIYPDRLPGDEA